MDKIINFLYHIKCVKTKYNYIIYLSSIGYRMQASIILLRQQQEQQQSRSKTHVISDNGMIWCDKGRLQRISCT